MNTNPVLLEQKFQTVIKPQSTIFDIKLKETWEYRDLIMLFVKREFVSKYKQTILGPLWAIIQPLLTTAVFTLIFGRLANLTKLDTLNATNIIIPGFLFYMAGTICWNYFSSTVNTTSSTFISNSPILGKVYFPRMVIPIATTIANLISFGIQFIMFLLIWAVYMIAGTTDMHITMFVFIVPLLIIQMMLMSMGCGIIISSLTTKYRDLAMLVGFGLQLWQYASPIAYGLALIPPKYMWIYMLNPITPILTAFRYAFFGTGYFSLTFFLISCLLTLVVLFFGVILFSKIEKIFIDTV